MSRGESQGRTEPQGSWPHVLVGDWIEIKSSPSWMMPLDGALAEITDVDKNGEDIYVIVNGQLVTGLSWSLGDRWIKTLPPEHIPPRFLRSQAAPSRGLATAFSWRDRVEPRHPHVLLTGKGEWNGWLCVVGGDQEALGVLTSLLYYLCEYDTDEGWEDEIGDLSQLDPDNLAIATSVARILHEADCMNRGFVLHAFVPDFELRLRGEDDRRGLEVIVEGFEALGCAIKLKAD